MDKIFISANELLLDSFRLARQIMESGFKPDFIVGVWRGGAPVGIAIQEYLAFLGQETDHIAIRTASYTGIDERHAVKVFGLHYIEDNFSADKSMLLVDDVFDTGRSVEAILNTLQERITDDLAGRIRIACPWFKPERNLTSIIPDYYLHQTDSWLVFPHELIGLDEQELAAKRPEVYHLMSPDYQVE